LEVEMIDFQKLANDYGTPLYVYDAVEIRERIRRAREVFKGFNAGIVFALKANGNPALLKKWHRKVLERMSFPKENSWRLKWPE
jgi:diaminopimelate decarboxylase